MILLVNKDHLFNEEMLDSLEMVSYENYKEEEIFIERETFRHFEMLRAHLRIEGIIIEIEDAYRSLEKQENIMLSFIKKYGYEEAVRTVAMPGFSEHHTGQAIDLIIKKGNDFITSNEELYEEKEIFEKIHNCLKYFGFILRYPKGKEDITGYSYEPWHIRYIGEEAALEIGDKTLEEYLK